MSWRLTLAACGIAFTQPVSACSGAVFSDAILPFVPTRIPPGASIYEVIADKFDGNRIESVKIVRVLHGYAPQSSIALPPYGAGDCHTAKFPKAGKAYLVAYPSYMDLKSFNVIFYNLDTSEFDSGSLFNDR